MLQQLHQKTILKSQVFLGNGFAFSELDGRSKKVAIITDENIYSLYKDHLTNAYVIPPGEHSKSREMKAFLEDRLLEDNFGRDSLIIGLGGGVVCDLTAFLAATYCRGVPFILIPTSLLAMVDAAIGGKAAVNTPYGKNMIGLFSYPEKIFIDTSFLETLPECQKVNGIVEMIKAGLIGSPGLFESLLHKQGDWLDWITESIEVKQRIVEQDPQEKLGIRRSLNLGHTIGHTLEVLENYTLAHGQAVAIGIVVECYISHKMGLLDEGSFLKIQSIFELPALQKKHPFEKIYTALSRDKKSVGSTPRFTLLEKIGKIAPFDGEYCTTVDNKLLQEAIEWMYE